MTKNTSTPNTPPISNNERFDTGDIQAARERFNARIFTTIQSPMELIPIFKKVFPECESVLEALNQLDEIKKCFESFQPYNEAQMEKLQEAWDTQYTYESNRIEGNTLTLRETSLIVNDGISVGGKALREILEAINHHAAVKIMREMAEKRQKLDVRTLLKLHQTVLRTIDDRNAGFFRDVHVGIKGTTKIFPTPVKVPDLIDACFRDFETDSQTLHPLLTAARLHHRLVHIHPFSDGNGRTSRLMQNLHLLQNGFVVANLKGEDSNKIVYYDALDAADAENYEPLYKLLIAEEKYALLRYISMLCGGIGEEEEAKGGYFFQKINSYL